MKSNRIARLEEVAAVRNGKTPSKTEQRDAGYPVLKIRDIDEHGQFRGPFASFVDVSLAQKFKDRHVKPDDILILNAAHNASYVGSKVCRATSEFEGALATGEWLMIRADPCVLDPGYAFHWVTLDKTRKMLAECVHGIHLYPKDVAKLRLPLPSLDDQRRIAAILDQADHLRQKRREAAALMQKLLQTKFRQLFDRLSSRGRSWPVVAVGDVTNCIVPGRDKPKSFTGSTPWVTTADLVHLGDTLGSRHKFGLSQDDIKTVNARVIPENSVVITCVGDLGVVSIARAKMVINQQLHAFQCENRLTPEYLVYALAQQEPYMVKMASNTTLPYMNKSICNSIPICVPSMDLQREFSHFYSVCAHTRNKFEESSAFLGHLFESIQHRAFNGEL